MNYDSSLWDHIKMQQVEPVLVIYVQFTQHTFQFLLTNKCISGEKNQVNFIEWNHTPQALNLYLSSDKQIWHISEICIFCGFVEKTLQYSWMNCM